jgi:MFS family permease
MKTPEQILSNNIRCFNVYKIFAKRLYLPVITLYLVSVVHLSLQQLALLTPVFTIASLLIEIPSGYYADKISRKTMYVIGSVGAVADIFCDNAKPARGDVC